MKASICPNCYWFCQNNDPLFPAQKQCDRLKQKLNGITVIECKHFKEAEQ